MAFPPTPFPAVAAEFTIPLPISVPTRIGDPPLTEIVCTTAKTDERGYTKDGHDMYAVTYLLTTVIGVQQISLLANARTLRLTESVDAIVKAQALYLASQNAYAYQVPPQTPPDNPGIGSPYTRDVIATEDGTQRFRGSCGGITSISAALVATVDVGFDPVWQAERP